LYNTKTSIIEEKTTTYMKNAFIYDASIEDKLDGEKTGGDRAEFRGFFDSLR